MKCFLSLLFLLFAGIAGGQTPQQKVVFGYDEAGNRIMRYIEEMVPDTVPVPLGGDAPEADTAAPEPTFTVSVYPNPVQADVQITIEPTAGAPDLPFVFDVRIVSTAGGALHYQQTHQYAAPISINMSAYDVGWYQLFVTRSAEVQQTNLLKQ
ncbi:MAG: hypothetical protein LBS12_06020 [Prevotellaceae bacterium]|jgi:hypothetical protein|nr:hypothetical protein [Prevotellaceae bacterium]